MPRLHQDNFATNLTSGTSASDTTSPLNSVPSIAAPFYLAFDATNINEHYEIVDVTSKTATNVLHAALAYDHTTAEEVRMVVPAVELDAFSAKTNAGDDGWISYSTVTPTRASADDPTYVLTFAGVDLTSTMSVGMKVKWTQNSTVRYGIITAIAFSTNTTLTLYGGTDYDVLDTATYAISAFNYSTQKAPLGFPLDPLKWGVYVTDTSSRLQASPSSGTVYNPGTTNTQISVPIGSWIFGYEVNAYVNNDSSTDTNNMSVSISTANNSHSDATMKSTIRNSGASGSWNMVISVRREKSLLVASKTLYYLVCSVDGSSVENIGFRGDVGNTNLFAVCAYL